MPSLSHIHTLARSPMKDKTGKVNKRRYYCQHPDCSYFNDKQHLLGKKSLCNQCGREILLTRALLDKSKPKCDFCSQTGKAKQLQAIAGIPEIDDLLKGLEGIVLPQVKGEGE